MSDKPLISVIMPTFNRAWCIKRAIDSVLNQTYQNFEIVITDDGSTDNTEEIIKSINDERIKYFKFSENLGVIEARNSSVINSKGKWLIFFDSDDELKPNAIDIFLKNIESDIKIYMANLIDTSTNIPKLNDFWKHKFKKQNNIATYNDFICNIATGDIVPFIKKELLEIVPYKTGSKRNLHIFWHELFKHSNVKFIDDIVLICHTEHEDRITKLREKHATLWIDGIKEYIEKFKDDITSKCPKHMAFHYKSLGIYQYFSGDKSGARRTFLRALEYNLCDYKVWIYLVASLNKKLFEKIANR